MNYPTHISSIFINLKEANFCMHWCQSLSKMPWSSVFKMGVLKWGYWINLQIWYILSIITMMLHFSTVMLLTSKYEMMSCRHKCEYFTERNQRSLSIMIKCSYCKFAKNANQQVESAHFVWQWASAKMEMPPKASHDIIITKQAPQ